MNRDQFEVAMRDRLYRKPFSPFDVEMNDGRIITVDREFTMGGGLVAYFNDDFDLVEIPCDKVKTIRPLAHEAAQ